MKKSTPTLSRILEVFRYDSVKGAVTTKIARQGSPAGKNVGCLADSGCLVIGLDGHTFNAHRLVYWMATGVPPGRDVVAINGDLTDLRWVNLHQLTPAEQAERYKRRSLMSMACKGLISRGEVPPTPTYAQGPDEAAIPPTGG